MVLTVVTGAIPDSGPAPLTVYFTATPSGGTGPFQYTWDFGDNTPKAMTQNAVHTYADGAFEAVCSVYDTATGLVATSSPLAVAVSAAIPNATFTIRPDQVCAVNPAAPVPNIPAPPNEETIPAGVANELLPAGFYHDNCLGEDVGVGSATVVTLTLVED